MSSAKNPTRDRILDTALQLLESGTGSAVRMTDIAKAAGLSRQAVYLHFPTRAELLVAAVRRVDELNDVEVLLIPSRSAATGRARLSLWIEIWGNYIPVIYGVGKALTAMRETDAEARAAWDDRMRAVRHGCAAVIADLARDGDLADGFTQDEATDLLWTLLSMRGWEQFRLVCGWTQARYVEAMKTAAARILIET